MKTTIKLAGCLVLFLLWIAAGKSYGQAQFEYVGKFSNKNTRVNGNFPTSPLNQTYTLRHIHPNDPIYNTFFYQNLNHGDSPTFVKTEGTLYAEWPQSMLWDDSNDGQIGHINRLGIMNEGTTTTTMYRLDVSGVSYPITVRGDISVQSNHTTDPYIFLNESVIELGPRGYDGTALIADVGPGYSGTLTFAHLTADVSWYGVFSGSDTLIHNVNWFRKDVPVHTSKLMAPKNVRVNVQDEGSGDFKVVVTFEKGTAYPTDIVRHTIFRKKAGTSNYVQVGIIPGSQTQYSESIPTDEGEYEYFVQTDLNNTWRDNFSLAGRELDTYSEPKVKATGDIIFSFGTASLSATDDKSSKITLRWDAIARKNVPTVTYFELFRNGQSLGIYSKSNTTYEDMDIIPGKIYKYDIHLLNENYDTVVLPGVPSIFSDYGQSTYNGRMSGAVKTSTGAGISGVAIEVRSLAPLARGWNGTQVVTLDTVYKATTDIQGNYQISNIYYDSLANFTISASIPGSTKRRLEHETLERQLDLQDFNIRNIDFLDTASYSVTGYVYYPRVAGSEIKLPVKDATILLNGKDVGVRTNTEGFYNMTITQVGHHNLQAIMEGHTIITEESDLLHGSDVTKTLYVDKDIKNINFADLTVKPLFVHISAYHDAPIGEYSTINIKSADEVPAELRHANDYRLDGFIKRIYSQDTTYTATFSQPDSTLDYEQVLNGRAKLMLPPTSFVLSVDNVYAKQEISGGPSGTSVQSDVAKNEFFIMEGPKTTDLAIADSVAHRDTNGNITKKPIDKEVRFTFFDGIQVVVGTLDEPESMFLDRYTVKNLNDKAYNVATQFDRIKSKIELYHIYAYDGVRYDAPLDTGRLTITDAVSDRKDPSIYNLSPGQMYADYTMEIGAPRIEHPWVKNITIMGELGSLEPFIYQDSAIVLGERARLGTFYTRSADKPLFVLHDPPGDNSYATLEKGTTFSWEKTTNTTFGGGAGTYTDSKLGKSFKTPFTQAAGGGIHLEATVQWGRNNSDDETTSISLTLNESFSTSADPNFVGEDGDVFVGNSINSTYSLTDVLAIEEIDKINKIINIQQDTVLLIDTIGFGTTFAYTQYHIREVLLPQLETLYSITQTDSIAARTRLNTEFERVRQLYPDDEDRKKDPQYLAAWNELDQIQANLVLYRNNIRGWTRTLEDNRRNRERAKDRILTLSAKGDEGVPGNVYVPGGVAGKNISFSSGAIYENMVQLDNTESTSDAEEIYFTSEFSAGYYAAVEEGFNEIDLGVKGRADNSETTTTVHSTSTSNIVTFHLEDDDPGDYFSVDIGSNPMYGTPVFTTVSGASSCPPEDGTQRRFMALIENEGTSVVNNVPATESAKFKVRITNRSESDETGTYGIRLVSTTNLNGAKVLVGGQDVINGQALYTIPTGESFVLPVEVIKGPIDSEYKDVTLVMYPSCEESLSEGEKIGNYEDSDTHSFVKLSASFQNPCSAVELFLPGNNWLVNQNHNDQLNVVFTGYNASSTSPLEYLQLEYRRLNTGGRAGEFQKLGDPIYKADLDKPQKQLVYMVDNLVDGDYELRAYVSCANGVNYSPAYVGKIDRQTAQIFGIPTPANGILTRVDIISVDYNKNVRNDSNNPVQVSLINTKTQEDIPARAIINGQRIQIVTIDPDQLDRLENEELEVSVSNVIDDESGNTVPETVTWKFVVSRSNLYWSPNSISINVEEGSTGLFTSTVRNKTALAQVFSLSKFPSWITPTIRNGSISPQGEAKIDFSVANILNTGTYADTIRVVNEGREQFLYLTVNVLKKAPDWKVDPSKYKYSMNLITQFSLNNDNIILSEDEFDKIAVYTGDEVRGVGHIEYDYSMNRYYAFITAYANNINEAYNFHFWDARPGIEYIAEETVSFVNGGVLGTIDEPHILHPTAIVQTIPLERGWNWISLFLENEDMSTPKVLSSMKPGNGDVITSVINNGKVSEYEQTVGWAGTLEHIELYDAYRIYVHKADTIRWVGRLPQEARALPLNDGWNTLGYAMPYNIELNSYLKDVVFPEGTRIVSQDEFAVYSPSTQTWNGSLKYLRPNKGYRIVVEGDASTFPFSTYVRYQAMGNAIQPDMNATALPRPEVTIKGTLEPDRMFDVSDFEGSMNTTYSFRYNGEDVDANNAIEKFARKQNNGNGWRIEKQAATTGAPATNTDLTALLDRFEVMTYVDDQLVGISKLQSLSNGQIRGFMASSMGADMEGKNVRFLVYDAQQDIRYNAKLSQEVIGADGNRAGTIGAPVVLTLEGNSNIEVSTNLTGQTIPLKQPLTYEVQLRNTGDDAAVNIKLEELIPSGFDIVDAQSLFGEVAVEENKWRYHTVSLKKDVIERITVTLQPKRVGIYAIGALEATVDNDTDLSNNVLYGQEIEVIDNRANDSKVFIPAILTPNGDGINDQFEIVGLGQFITDVNIVIYDKASNVIYRNTNYQNEWDGGNYPIGSYGYYIKAKNQKGEQVIFTGYVSIVR